MNQRNNKNRKKAKIQLIVDYFTINANLLDLPSFLPLQ
ncbi:hypothetical protein VRK_03890 [Vibrio sp. MEBiC08052]|nr:hypothetical protein VRK_03890 [Vibrio sp. MEBiC08052]